MFHFAWTYTYIIWDCQLQKGSNLWFKDLNQRFTATKGSPSLTRIMKSLTIKLSRLSVIYKRPIRCPLSTRIVKDAAGHFLLRDDNDYACLLPFFSKRQYYLEICHSSGWKPVWADKGKAKFKPIHEWQPRDGFCLADEQQVNLEIVQPIVSWRSFRRCWTKQFPKLKVRAKGEDTCADCYHLKLKL